MKRFFTYLQNEWETWRATAGVVRQIQVLARYPAKVQFEYRPRQLWFGLEHSSTYTRLEARVIEHTFRMHLGVPFFRIRYIAATIQQFPEGYEELVTYMCGPETYPDLWPADMLASRLLASQKQNPNDWDYNPDILPMPGVGEPTSDK